MKWRVNNYKTKIVFCLYERTLNTPSKVYWWSEKKFNRCSSSFQAKLEKCKRIRHLVQGAPFVFVFVLSGGKCERCAFCFQPKKSMFFGYFAWKRNSKKYEATQHEMKQNEWSLHKSTRRPSPSQPLSHKNLLFIIYRKDKFEAKRKQQQKWSESSEKEPETWNAEFRLTTRE